LIKGFYNQASSVAEDDGAALLDKLCGAGLTEPCYQLKPIKHCYVM
jgi:hypothetical protein